VHTHTTQTEQVGMFPCRGLVAPCRALPAVSRDRRFDVKRCDYGVSLDARQLVGDILFRRHTLLQFFQPVEDHLDAQGAGLRRALLGFNRPDDRSVRRHVKASWRIRN